MTTTSTDDRWAAGDAYEDFMGRWSRPLAERFIRWLGAEPGGTWLDVGCGTGALTSAILAPADPAAVVACDPSEAFVEHVTARIPDSRLLVVCAGVGELPEIPDGFDHVVSGLVINFLPEPERSLGAMAARARGGGGVAGYVWDYAGRMEILRAFWDEAVALDPSASSRDEGVRFPICRPEALEALFRGAGLRHVSSNAIEIPTRFDSFEEYWRPFLGGTGPAPAHVASLTDAKREELRGRLERRLAPGGGSLDLTARAWAVRGTVA